LIDRRTFLVGTGAVLFAAPLAGEAQQAGKVYRIGIMQFIPVSNAPQLLDAFRQELRELGWVEGKNIEFENVSAEGKLDRFPAVAAELVRRRVDLIIAGTTVAARAAKNATSTVPILIVVAADAVGSGLIDSLARPGGNITGLTLMTVEIQAKQLEILKEAMPQTARVSVLRNGPTIRSVKELESAARLLRIQLQLLTAGSPKEIDDAFPTMIRGRSDAFLVVADPLYWVHRKRLAELAAKARLPGMFPVQEYVEAGGLMAYGPSYLYAWRRTAVYVDKILKGAKPADLPVEQPTKFDLVINLKTAKALGLTIPPSLLGRADQVIQ